MEEPLGRYQEALEYAGRMHEGQFRIGGLPYITHPIAVAELVRQAGYGEEYQIAALFHDLLEDTEASEEKILEIGGERVLRAVRLLTKRPGCAMEEYVAGIRGDEMAFVVKGADRLHNLRSAFCAKERFKRRYIRESAEWYMDFHPEIPEAIRLLEKSLAQGGEKK